MATTNTTCLRGFSSGSFICYGNETSAYLLIVRSEIGRAIEIHPPEAGCLQRSFLVILQVNPKISTPFFKFAPFFVVKDIQDDVMSRMLLIINDEEAGKVAGVRDKVESWLFLPLAVGWHGG